MPKRSDQSVLRFRHIWVISFVVNVFIMQMKAIVTPKKNIAFYNPIICIL